MKRTWQGKTTTAVCVDEETVSLSFGAANSPSPVTTSNQQQRKQTSAELFEEMSRAHWPRAKRRESLPPYPICRPFRANFALPSFDFLKESGAFMRRKKTICRRPSGCWDWGIKLDSSTNSAGSGFHAWETVQELGGVRV